jgi:hypothetical protein
VVIPYVEEGVIWTSFSKVEIVFEGEATVTEIHWYISFSSLGVILNH